MVIKDIKTELLILTFLIGGLVIADVRNPSTPGSRSSRYSTQSYTDPYASSQYNFNPNTGNDIMTGNVGGGREFRGVVPYGSPYEFQGTQGSSTLTNFYRRTSSARDFETNPSDSFYLPSRSVTSFRRDDNYNLSKPSANQDPFSSQINIGRVSQQKIEPDRAELRPSLGDLSPLRPLSSPLESREKGLEQYLNERIPTDKDKLAIQPEKIDYTAVTTKDMLSPVEEAIPKSPFDIQPVDAEKEQEKETLIKQVQQEKKPDVYQQMLDGLQKQFEEQVAKMHEENLKVQEEKRKQLEEQKKADLERIRNLITERRGGKTSEEPVPDEKAAAGEEDQLPETFKSFAAASNDRFNQYMKAAEELMQAGQFYKAADAYALAAAYDNRHPLAYAGQTHALFSAGEYMSSSFYLARTLKIFGYYALLQIDIKKMIGNDEIFNKRINELVKLEEQSGSAELEMLLAYIYKNTGENQKAVDYINLAARKQPDNTAIQTLQKAITE